MIRNDDGNWVSAMAVTIGTTNPERTATGLAENHGYIG